MKALEQYLLIAVGGAVGSCLRYWLGSHIASRYGTAFPWGTFVINVTGSLVIGVFLALTLERAPIDPRWRFLVAVGFCGGYTTFSTFTYETAQLLQGRGLVLAVANVVLSAVVGIAAVFGGAALSRWL